MNGPFGLVLIGIVINQSMADTFLVVWLIGVLLIWPPWIWLSIRGRRVRGEPLIPKPPANASFCERGGSGFARGSLFGNANRCLQVAVTGDQLWITPTFPF